MSFTKSSFYHSRERKFTQASPENELDFSLSPESQSANQLTIHGQGVLIFKIANQSKGKIKIVFSNSNASPPENLSIELEVGHLTLRKNEEILAEEDKIGLTTHERAFYWLSLDAQNQVIRFGLGEARLETQRFSYFLFPGDKKYLEGLNYVDFDAQTVQPLRILRDPIQANVPLKVKNTEELTMEMVATSAVMPKAHLSSIAQKLYDTIAGKNFILNTPDFPDFVEAIEYSIATPGCWCYQKLQMKAGEFGDKNPKKVYLRITLGQNGGESPGIPFVMEIWPAGCYSPIHNHAGANAVIRVLHGQINVTLFPYLGTEEAFGEKTFSEGDITWISPTLNQFHKLENKNESGPTCITIQCYMYDEDDHGHYDYFDYINDHDEISQYEPDSDMDFLAFKAQIRKEWIEK